MRWVWRSGLGGRSASAVAADCAPRRGRCLVQSWGLSAGVGLAHGGPCGAGSVAVRWADDASACNQVDPEKGVFVWVLQLLR